MEESFIAPNPQNETSPEIIKRKKIEKELTHVLENYADNEEKFSTIYKRLSALSTELRRFLNQEKQTYTTFLQHLGPHSYKELPKHIARIESKNDKTGRKRELLMRHSTAIINRFENEEDRRDHFTQATKINNDIVRTKIITQEICNLYTKLMSILG